MSATVHVLPTSFWESSDYSIKEYEGETLTAELLESVEQELGYRLPKAYVELMKIQNGGIPRATCHRTADATSWAHDHVAITGIYGINRSKRCSLAGEFGSRFWIDEWEYPPIGVYFCDCPSAGHDMLCLDYSLCGPQGEPRVVHVDQEFDFKITLVANTFQDFVLGLEPEENFT